jgi:hypothetical protein
VRRLIRRVMRLALGRELVMAAKAGQELIEIGAGELPAEWPEGGRHGEGSFATGTNVLTLSSHEGAAAKSQLAGQDPTAGHAEWGGWGSNPRPADYESAALTC